MNRHSIALAATLAALSPITSQAHGNAAHAAPARPYVAAEVIETAFGRQGDPKKVTRTLTVDMADSMRFTPGALTVKRGETVRLKVANKGQVLHELVLGTPNELRLHAEMMKKHPGMQHDEPSMVHVAPGQAGEIVWQFTQPGEFEFACLVPGHFEAGMRGKVVVR